MFSSRLDSLGRNLHRTLLTYFVLPVLLFGLGLPLVAGHLISSAYDHSAISELSTQSMLHANRIDQALTAPIAALTTMQGEFTQPDFEQTLRSVLQNIQIRSPWVAGIALMSADGTPLATAGHFLPLSRELPVVTDVTLAPDGRPVFHMAASLPADPDDRLVCLSVDAQAFSSQLDRVRIGRTGEIFLMNAQGVLQTRSVLHGAILDRVDSHLIETATQTERVLVRPWQEAVIWYESRPVAAIPGWSMVIQRDAREIFEKRDLIMTQLVFAGLASLALLITLAAATLVRTARLRARMREECLHNAEQIMLVRKLDAINQLGVGIAHEVNNPLAIIGEEAGWMQDVLRRSSFVDNPDAPELRDSLRQITLQTARSREITHKLLSFGGRTDGVIRDTDLNQLVRDAMTLRRREAAERHIELVEDLSVGLPIIMSEPALLRQALVNLVTNAMDAMPDGGTITLRTRPLPDGGARLTVRDSGFGIPEENMDKVCEPFFSTKPPGKGAGLGLCICHSIMQRIGGRMHLESRAGQGTTVSVDLPLDGRPSAS